MAQFALCGIQLPADPKPRRHRSKGAVSRLSHAFCVPRGRGTPHARRALPTSGASDFQPQLK